MKKRGNRFIDRTGEKFGKLTVLKFSHSEKRKNSIGTRSFWECICECGKKVIVDTSCLTSRGTQSCGCLRDKFHIKHSNCIDRKTTRTYRTWLNMKSRCLNKKATGYGHYGGRGITICDRWLDFRNFLKDMGERPAGTSIDRINPDGNYEPSNCRWALNEIQKRNKRNIRLLNFNGEKKCLTEWAKKYNIHINTLNFRIKIRKWSLKEALETPVNKKYSNF